VKVDHCMANLDSSENW